MEELVRISTDDSVATVTMNRPHARNALNSELRAELRSAIASLDADPAVRAVVLTGADPAFCAGLDLRELGQIGVSSDASVERGPFGRLVTPLIGAINGPAVTGGFEIALACDFLIASERARFADTHARVGVMPGWGLTVALPEAVGTRRARQLSLTGNFLDAGTALEWGLVNEVIPHDALIGRATELASEIAGNDPDGVAQMLSTYNELADVTDDERWRIELSNAETWKQRGIAPAEIERRRQGIIARGRTQI